MKYINKIKSIVLRLYNNIKYILCNNLNELDIIDNIDDRLYSLDDRVSNMSSELDDKCDEYQVEDVIYNQFGSVDDLATYDDINDVKDDIKEINKKLNTIIDEDLKVTTSLFLYCSCNCHVPRIL